MTVKWKITFFDLRKVFLRCHICSFHLLPHIPIQGKMFCHFVRFRFVWTCSAVRCNWSDEILHIMSQYLAIYYDSTLSASNSASPYSQQSTNINSHHYHRDPTKNYPSPSLHDAPSTQSPLWVTHWLWTLSALWLLFGLPLLLCIK